MMLLLTLNVALNVTLNVAMMVLLTLNVAKMLLLTCNIYSLEVQANDQNPPLRGTSTSKKDKPTLSPVYTQSSTNALHSHVSSALYFPINIIWKHSLPCIPDMGACQMSNLDSVFPPLSR